MKLKYYLLCTILISVLPLIVVVTNNLLPHTHDGLVHLPRMAAYYKALGDGQFPVRWAGDLNYGYGLPLFNFIYQTPYLISSLLLKLGFGLVFAFKITLVLSFILSGIGMFLFAKEFFKDNRQAFLVTIFYQFFPFRFVELFVRGSFGEVYTYAFLPFVLYGIARINNKKSYNGFLFTSISTALLVLSHNSVSLLFFLVCVGFVLFFIKDKQQMIVALLALGVGLLLSMFYWLPAIGDHRYTYGNLHMKNLYKEHFAPFYTFFLPNITNNSALQTGGISVSLGIMHVLAIISGVYLYIKNKKGSMEKRIISFSGILLLCSFFFMHQISQFVWENLSLLRQFQFPWRFLALGGFATSLLSISFTSILKKNILYWIIIGITVGSTIFYWKASLGYDKVDEAYYWNFPLNTTYYGETDLIWSEGPAKKYPKQPVEFVSGKGTIKEYAKTSYFHRFRVNAEVDSVVVDNTQYFPGWTAYVDGKKMPIEFQDQNWRGLITVPVPKGNHLVVVQFEETKLRVGSNIISLVTLFGVVGFILFRKRII